MMKLSCFFALKALAAALAVVFQLPTSTVVTFAVPRPSCGASMGFDAPHGSGLDSLVNIHETPSGAVISLWCGR